MVENILFNTFWTLIIIEPNFPANVLIFIDFSRITEATDFDDFIFNKKA